jgi:cell division protein FtsW
VIGAAKAQDLLGAHMKTNRTDLSVIGKWWWTVDRPTWFALLLLMVTGAIMVTASSPMVAERIGLPSFHFVHRHGVFVAMTALVMFLVSLLSPNKVRQLALLVCAVSLVLLLALPFIGYENKGAIRWIRLGGLSLQPSEFLKPAFVVMIAWIFSQKIRHSDFPGYKLAIGLYVLVVGLLILQPDFGMTVVVTAVFGLQFFLAGVPMVWVAALVALALVGAISAYSFLPHVTSLIDRFLDPSSGDNYQVDKALEAFAGGGFLGRGPGEGQVKAYIPDSHTDFIFAVIGEEYGVLVCLLIIGLYGFVVLRGLLRLMEQQNVFIVLAASGLLAQFGLQALINMGVAVNLLPAKGMTLPLLSYGGSSLLAVGLSMGMLLALTRKQYGELRGRA